MYFVAFCWVEMGVDRVERLLNQENFTDQSRLTIQLSKAQSILDGLNKTGMNCPYV